MKIEGNGWLPFILFTEKGLRVRRSRGLRYFLLALSFLISLNVAYLYHAHYGEIDLLVRKHFSDENDENLLAFINKNDYALPSPGPSIQHPIVSFLELFFQPVSTLPQDSKTFVLRC